MIKRVITAVAMLAILVGVAHADRYGKVRIYGEIIALDSKMYTVTIRAQNGLEETFLVDASTKIEQDYWGGDKYVSYSGLKVGQHVKAKYYEPHYERMNMQNPNTSPTGPMKVLREIDIKR